MQSMHRQGLLDVTAKMCAATARRADGATAQQA
jgi:hypothetical protein